MNIKEFLMANYVYILIVIVLIIITIIGFLADKKKNKGKDNSGNNNLDVNNGGMAPVTNNQQPVANPQVFYQLSKDNIAGNNQNMNNVQSNGIANFGQLPNNVVTPVSNNMNSNQNFGNVNSINNNIQPVNNGVMSNVVNNVPLNASMTSMNNPTMNNETTPQPVEPINNNMIVNTEPMYQPLSEQKPVIMPSNPIGMVANNINQSGSSYNNQPMNNGKFNIENNIGQSLNSSQSAVNPVPIPNPTNINPAPIPPVPTSPVMPQPTPVVPNNNMSNQMNNVPNQQSVNFVYGNVPNQNNGEYR